MNAIGVLLLAAGAATAQPPGVDALAAAIRDAGARTVWLTYRVATVPGPRRICFDNITMSRSSDPGDLRPAVPAATELMVYGRFENGRLTRIRAFTPDCPVDADQTPVIAVAGVTPAASIAWLASAIAGASDDRPAMRHVLDPALLALSLHADASAVPRLVAFARDDPRVRVREQALFWLAQRAGDRAAAVIGGAAENDPDAAVRKRAVFALSQLPKDEGVPKLIEVARTNAHADARREAIFWLGQSHDPRALQFLEEILTK